MEATNDINIKGSRVVSDGTVQLTAEHDINIVNDKNTMYTESKREKKGRFSSSSKLETDYKESAAASTIIGNNVTLDATNDIKIQASNVIAVKKDNTENTGGNIIAKAGNDIKITTDDMNNEYHLKEKKKSWSASASTGGGGATAGVSYSKSKLEVDRTNVIIATSSIISEGNTILEAGNKVRTEAMQANVGENLIISGKNGVELVDAQEIFNEKVKQETKTVGVSVSVGSTITDFISSANDKSKNNGKYGFGNKSELINSYGDGLDLYRGGVKAGADASQLMVDSMKGSNLLENLGAYGVNASVSLNVSKSKYESTTNGTTSVAGEINVGKNFIISSEGDVKLVNQKVNVGENLIVDAKNFEATAGKNTHNNKTDSSSSSASLGYDAIGKTVTGGVSGNKGNSNSSSVSYDNTVINVGGGFHLNTKEDAVFKGANVKADKIEFEIGGNLTVESLQDEYKLDGKNKGAGLNYGHNDTSNGGYNSPVGNISYGESKGDSKWVNNQTTIIAESGGNINVGETLTNIGSIIGSKNDTMNIEAKELVTENLKDHDKGKDYNVGLGGIDSKNRVPQTELQYSSHDKEQDTNATFVNTVVKENGKEVDLEERGINTDIDKSQVVTKDDVVEQIDTVLHTDLMNGEKRKDLVNDLNTISENSEIIVDSIGTKLNNNKNGNPDAGIGKLEEQSLANITKAVEEVVKNKENLVLTEADRADKEKLKESIKEKYEKYGVTDVIIIKDDEQLMGEDGEMHSVNAAFSRDGVIYITESTANGTLKNLNKFVGEEVGEIYAQNNGLENDHGKAQQIGEIFGNYLSGDSSDSKSNNKMMADDVDLSDVVIGGTSTKVSGVGLKCKGRQCSNSTIYYNFPSKVGKIVIEKEMSTEEIYNKALQLIAKGNEKGYADATRYLTHWLEGSGTTMAVPQNLFEHKNVKDAIEYTYLYFGSENALQRKNIYDNISKGVLEFDESWDRSFSFDPRFDTQNYVAYGTASVKSSGKISIKDSGNYYDVTVTIKQNKFYDTYDWNNGQGTGYFNFFDSVEDAAMKKLEGKNSYGAKEFRIEGIKNVDKVIKYQLPKHRK